MKIKNKSIKEEIDTLKSNINNNQFDLDKDHK